MGTSSNAHTLLKEQLEDHLNRNKNLAQLIHILHETYTPLMSISKLPSVPHLGVLPVVSKEHCNNIISHAVFCHFSHFYQVLSLALFNKYFLSS